MSFISSILLLKSHTLFGAWDMQFHLRRIVELQESIIHNNFLPSFSFNSFHGSAIMSFYPYLNLFPIIILSIFFDSKITLIYSFFIFNTFITFIISYFSCENYTKNIGTSYLFSVIYSLSNIFLAYNFVSMDLGIVTSFIFLPLIIFSFLSIINGQNKWKQLSFGMSIIALSHIMNLIIVTIFLLFWLIINIKNINKYVIYRLLKAIVLFLFITSVMWLPLLDIYIHNFRNILSPSSIPLNRIGIKTFLSGIYNGVNYENIGLFALIAIFISFFLYNRFNVIMKQMYIMSILIILGVLLFPKQITSFGFLTSLNHFQFTFRFLIIPQILLSFIFSIVITNYIKIKHIRNIIYIFLICLTIFLQLLGQYNFIKNNSNYPTIDQYLSNNKILNLTKEQRYKLNTSSQFYMLVNANTTGNDYIPKNALDIYPYVNANKGFYNYSHSINFENTGYNKFEFIAQKNMYNISFPIYLYNNEKLNVYLNGKKINYYADKYGMLSINNIKNDIGSKNILYIKPVPDKFRIIGFILSFISIFVSLLFFIYG